MVKDHLLRTKGGGAAGPLSVGYSTPAGGFWPKNAIFLGGAEAEGVRGQG